MFEDLKARQSGFTAKEKTKLIVMVSGAAVLGCLVLGLKGCTQESGSTLPTAKSTKAPESKERPLDLTRLKVRTADIPLDRFDAESLAYVIGEIRGGALPRHAPQSLTPADVVALDPKAAAGTLVEVVGTVRSLDHEAYAAPQGTVDQLWAFGLEGEDGKAIAVVHPGSTQEANGGAPADAFHPGSGSPPIKSGDLVRVRGVYLQQRTGTIGAFALSGPTPVVVGREYRRTTLAKPVAKLEEADWEDVHDRSLEETLDTDEKAYYQALAWAQAKGHDAILSMMKNKEMRVDVWGRDMFLLWHKELTGDKDQSLADPRAATLLARGKVFTTTGALAYFSAEDWDTIANNASDVGRRWKVWILSDFYHHAPIRFDSPFPITDFPGIVPPPERGEWRQRVRAFGVFYKNATFTPKVAENRTLPQGMSSEVTLPAFLLLHLEPDAPIVGLPYYENPFFWTWVSLVVFGAAFFTVMHKIEKREAGQMRDQNLRIRRRQRELAGQEGAAPAGAETSGAPPDLSAGTVPGAPPSVPPPP